MLGEPPVEDRPHLLVDQLVQPGCQMRPEPPPFLGAALEGSVDSCDPVGQFLGIHQVKDLGENVVA